MLVGRSLVQGDCGGSLENITVHKQESKYTIIYASPAEVLHIIVRDGIVLSIWNEKD